jgi:hypothetical protein
MTKRLFVFFSSVIVALTASTAAAQGVQTGTLTGTVRDQGSLPLPGGR